MTTTTDNRKMLAGIPTARITLPATSTYKLLTSLILPRLQRFKSHTNMLIDTCIFLVVFVQHFRNNFVRLIAHVYVNTVHCPSLLLYTTLQEFILVHCSLWNDTFLLHTYLLFLNKIHQSCLCINRVFKIMHIIKIIKQLLV